MLESLNERGTPLTQADLIRNYLFMRIEKFVVRRAICGISTKANQKALQEVHR